MNDEQLRALVRESVRRHLSSGVTSSVTAPAPAREHASHGRFQMLTGADVDGPCLIEPSVQCTHCGYCQSYGH